MGFAQNESLYNESPTMKNVIGPYYHKTVRIVVIATMISFSLVGNIIVCWRLLPNRRHSYSKATVLFLNLAIADLLVTVLTMTSQLVWEVMDRVWIADDSFCRIFKVLQTFALVSSTYMLVSIALDRHFAVVHPLSPCPQPSRLAISAWFCSLLPSLPNLFIFRKVEVSNGLCYCTSVFYTESYPQYYRQIYMAFIFLSIFVIPLLLLICLYSRILLEIWKQSSSMDHRCSTASTLPRAKVKTLRMTLTIFAAFMLTNLPYVIQELILAFGDSTMLDGNIVALFGVISASNSSLNPYIYLTFHSKNSCFGGRKKKDGNCYHNARSTDTLRTTIRSTFSNKRMSNPRLSLSINPLAVTHDSVVQLSKWTGKEIIKVDKNMFR